MDEIDRGSAMIALSGAMAACLVTTALLRPRLQRIPSDRIAEESETNGRKRASHKVAARGAFPTAVFAIGCLVLLGPALIVATALALLVLHRFQRRRRRLADQATIERSAPEVFDVVATLLRAGLTPQQACGGLAEFGPTTFRLDFQRLLVRCANGERFADALGTIAADRPMLRDLVDALIRSERYGDPIRPIIDRLNDEARQRRRRQTETSARQLPVRLCFPLVCCTLPAFVLLTIVPLLIGALSSLRQSF